MRTNIPLLPPLSRIQPQIPLRHADNNPRTDLDCGGYLLVLVTYDKYHLNASCVKIDSAETFTRDGKLRACLLVKELVDDLVVVGVG